MPATATGVRPAASATAPASAAARRFDPYRPPDLPDPPEPEAWRAAAACAGLAPELVFTRRLADAAPALRACAACPVRAECEAAVAPAESWFDGVCAGRLWRNGRPSADLMDLDHLQHRTGSNRG
ncbi:WhiB family transcriptional regulator [Streptomyces sp. NPDC126497]|uniref:WhiB family transcriptional regulator n=1 Tax=Streptomyces sp. NPDC126497 TaxID=3155313 RepID=UPI00332E428D